MSVAVSAHSDSELRVRRASWTGRQRRKNDVIYLCARLALALTGLLPRATLPALGRFLGLVTWALASGARRVTRENLERVLGVSPAKSRAMGRRCFRELGALLGDTLALFRPHERASRTLALPPEAAQVFADARAHGRGVVLVTAHFGSWERLAALLVASGLPLTTPVKPSYDPRLERDVLARLRGSRGVRALDRDGKATPIALLRALRRNELAGFLVDLRTRAASVVVPFLGVPASTVTAPARLALRTGAPVVLAVAGRREVHARLLRPAAAPLREIDEEAVISLTAAIAEGVGEAIRQDPTRWIWMHDRWTC